MSKIAYNERSWAIDVISTINIYLQTKSWHFKSSGGEHTVKNNKSSLFPDVLLFKDNQRNGVLQGWELKMPDTRITDIKLIENASKKAELLQKNSFLLWNVKTAVLYVKEQNKFELVKTWTCNINNRRDVQQNNALWKKLLFNILEDLNSYFETGQIKENITNKLIGIDELIDIMLENKVPTSEFMMAKIVRSSKLEAKIHNWWLDSAGEYGFRTTDKDDMLPTLSMVVLTDWIFKFIFANILKAHFNEAKVIEDIKDETQIDDAIKIIERISLKCNFWNIFSAHLAQNLISKTAWNQLKELNSYLSSLNMQNIGSNTLNDLLENTVSAGKRKIAGQFSTPPQLAEFLTRITIDDKTKKILDPCCGTGTIIKQTYLLKKQYELNNDEILNSIWASDKHSFPIQLATLTLTKPEIFGKILNIFTSDVIDLECGENIKFKNPNNGSNVIKQLPKFDYIVSNLPFIKSKDVAQLNSKIISINNWIQQTANISEQLSGKSDIFAYIPFYLYKILDNNGKIGLILSNAWLGTEYGEKFLSIFQHFYQFEKIIISGKGKWFDNADIVTTILIASKKHVDAKTDQNHTTKFITLKENIKNISNIKQFVEDIVLGKKKNSFTQSSYTLNEIHKLERLGTPWSAYFANLKWLPPISNKLINANEIFNFIRGERRGWNPLFYPGTGHNIEAEYIHPVLKDLRGTKSLECEASKEAFSCSKSIQELEVLNHTGALAWIKSFGKEKNKTGKLLTKSLQRTNMYWYEMTTDSMAEFVANINYDRSLFIAKFKTISFIDQRMIGLSIKPTYQEENQNLLLALLNSTLSMFFIESLGFGRGQGALDLNATKFKNNFKILNPNNISITEKSKIINAFKPIQKRERRSLEQEIEMPDRIHFENILLNIYGISQYYASIKKSLLDLYNIRFAVKK